MKALLIFCLIIIHPVCFSQTDLFATQKELLNTKIDSISITHYLLNEPFDKNYNSKFKVLEFWASWCRPCLKAVPHLNKLQRRFKDQNVIFLSFTYETPKRALQSFEKVKFETVVVSDTTRSMHRNLRVEYKGKMILPRTVLINSENIIIWYGNPRQLKTRTVRRFLKNEKIIV